LTPMNGQAARLAEARSIRVPYAVQDETDE